MTQIDDDVFGPFILHFVVGCASQLKSSDLLSAVRLKEASALRFVFNREANVVDSLVRRLPVGAGRPQRQHSDINRPVGKIDRRVRKTPQLRADLDALPVDKAVQVGEQVMTPHHRDYYEGKPTADGTRTPPAEYHNPVPVPFLVVNSGVFQTAVVVDHGRVTADQRPGRDRAVKLADDAAASIEDAVDEIPGLAGPLDCPV